MKLIATLMLSLFAFSALAVEVPLYDIKDADRYNLKSLRYEYDSLYKAVVLTIDVKDEYQLPGHNETYQDSFIAINSQLKLEGNTFKADISGQKVSCAVMSARGALDTGLCRLTKKLNGNVLEVSMDVTVE